MNPLIQLQRATPIFIIALACIGGLVPKTHAVSPPPDGGYPGGNTAEGDNALLNLTSGAYNTAVGFASLRALTAGNLNTATGADTLLVNTASENTATGAGALLSNTTGSSNTANGALALLSNTQGNFNTAMGDGALQTNSEGNDNTAMGFDALHSGGDQDTAVGSRALQSEKIGGGNTAIGFQALAANRQGMFNTAIGDVALLANEIGDNNTAVGSGALSSFNPLTFGGGNTAVGTGALSMDTTGGSNTALGAGAGSGVTTASNVICIGAAGNNVSNSCYVGNIFGSTSSNGIAVVVNTNGRLGTMTSSARFKDEIKPMGKASEALFGLKPVIFRYKKELDPEGTPQFGLVAEEVEKVNPDLVVRDKDGKPYSVRYEQVNAMLLNEFLKEHRKVEQQVRELEEQRATISELKNEIGSVIAYLKEQDSKTQRGSEQIKMNEFAAGRVRRGGASLGVVTNDRQTVQSNTSSQ